MKLDRRFLFISCVAAAAACSQPPVSSAVPVPATHAMRPEASRPAAATPVQYFYTVNYNSNDVSQVGVYTSKPYLKLIAPNVPMPSACNPDSLAIAHLQPLLFVSCNGGSIVTLKIDPTTYKLSASKIKPVPVASPLYLIAPATGAKGQLYADGYNGDLYQLSYTAKVLKMLHKYTTTSIYPDQMAFYTSAAGTSTLFVAAPYDSTTCGATMSGDIVPWQQNSDGSLVEQAVIPACSTAYHVVVAGNNLFWAAANYLGGYSLTKHTTLSIPAPPWAATSKGPSYYPDDMTVVQTLSQQRNAHGSDTDWVFITAGTDGYVTAFDEGGKVRFRSPIAGNREEGSHCSKLANGVLINGVAYANFCISVDGDDVNFYGVTKEGKKVHIVHLHPGSLPYELEVAPIKL